MEKDIAIEFKNVSKIYKLKRKDKEVRKDEKTQYFYALKNLSFQVKKGQVLGILGTNGSGKSTMALVLSGIASPDEGEITVNGEQALVAINTGLNKQLTGLENIELKGALLGLPKKKIQEIIDGVIEFAEIGDFLYQPVKKYSSGMKSRLGFSINLCLNPDIMIIDEALSVGDKGFAQKCLNRMKELKEEGKTIIFISHSLPQVRDFCDSAMWLEGGQMKEYGGIEEVCDHYAEYIENYNTLSKAEKKAERDEKFKERIIINKKVSLIDRLFG
jgi:teichoic acid transport system ATP-binding protein